jgi:hypothetical protein
MPMQIQIYLSLVLQAELAEVLSDLEYLWVEVVAGLVPLTVEVDAAEVGAEVAVDDAVDVYHWE